LLIRKVLVEYGCAEAGRLDGRKNGTKLLWERGLKTPKMMKDIFDKLCEVIDGDERKIRKLETIGFLHSGLSMSLLRLDSPAGYMCRITSSKSFCIPSQVAEFGAKALPVILLAWRAKIIVTNMIRLIEEDVEVDDEERLQNLLDSCETVAPAPSKRPRMYLPSNLDTPPKKRIIALGELGSPIPFKLPRPSSPRGKEMTK
jgi:hypothetical protein